MPGMHSQLRLRHAPLLLVACVAVACGSSTPTPLRSAAPSAPASASAVASQTAAPTGSAAITANPSADASANQVIYAEIETQVEQLRMLSPKAPVSPILLDEKGVRDWMTKATQTGVDHKALAAESRLLIHLGMLPAGSSLEQLELDLNAGQAIGFYDPTSKQLYLLSTSGSVGAEERLTFSHEFTHALQDQNFGLDKLAIDTPDQGDRDLAHTALPEGDASLSMTQWAAQNMSPLDLLAVSVASGSGPQADQLAAAPAILREDLYFPYIQGLSFVQGVYEHGGWPAVDKLYTNPPSSTSQILHPELYSKGIGPVNLTLTALPAVPGAGWDKAVEDTLGELQLRVWLEGEHPSATAKQSADDAASTWAGDRIGLWENTDGSWATILRTQWRSAAGRTAFAAAATTRLDGLTSPYIICGDAVHADIIMASDTTTMSQFATCNPME
jgi:hypothetical protein